MPLRLSVVVDYYAATDQDLLPVGLRGKTSYDVRMQTRWLADRYRYTAMLAESKHVRRFVR